MSLTDRFRHILQMVWDGERLQEFWWLRVIATEALNLGGEILSIWLGPSILLLYKLYRGIKTTSKYLTRLVAIFWRYI